MASVDPLYAQWLQAEANWVVREDAALAGIWGDTGATAERMSALADKADADAEAQRQLAFLSGPLVLETAELQGDWADYIGSVIAIEHEDLGYRDGVDVFLIGAQDNHATGISTVTVLRRL